MKQADLDHWFSYHKPDEVDLIHYEVLRSMGKEFAEYFDAAVPDCADKTAAMRKLRETVMAMNLAIACYAPPPTIAT